MGLQSGLGLQRFGVCFDCCIIGVLKSDINGETVLPSLVLLSKVGRSCSPQRARSCLTGNWIPRWNTFYQHRQSSKSPSVTLHSDYVSLLFTMLDTPVI
jgi:hypothetical protein